MDSYALLDYRNHWNRREGFSVEGILDAGSVAGRGARDELSALRYLTNGLHVAGRCIAGVDERDIPVDMFAGGNLAGIFELDRAAFARDGAGEMSLKDRGERGGGGGHREGSEKQEGNERKNTPLIEKVMHVNTP